MYIVIDFFFLVNHGNYLVIICNQNDKISDNVIKKIVDPDF